MQGRQPDAQLKNDLGMRLYQGDETVLSDILRQVGPRIKWVLCQSFSGVLSEEDIEDVMAITLWKACKHRENYDEGEGSVGTWLSRIALNTARDFLKSGWQRARRLEEDSEAYDVAQLAVLDPVADDTLVEPESANLVKEVKAVIDRLPEKQRRILLADAMANDRIASTGLLAEELGIPVVTVRVYRKRALDTVRSELRRRGFAVP